MYFIFRSVNIISLSFGSSRAIPSLGPPQPACKSSLIACLLFCFARKSFTTRFASLVTSNIILPPTIVVHDLFPRGPLRESCTSKKGNPAAKRNLSRKPDRYLIAFHNHRHLPFATGENQHFIEFFRISPHVDKNSFVSISRTSLIAERTIVGSIDNDFIRHNYFLSPTATYLVRGFLDFQHLSARDLKEERKSSACGTCFQSPQDTSPAESAAYQKRHCVLRSAAGDS